MPKTEDLIFNPHGRRHYRRRYSLGEVKVSLFVLLGLGLITAYVAYAGAHPGPERAQSVVLDPGLQAGAKAVSREPLPEGLAAEQFVESAVRHFDAENLYEKINGRAGYFTARGFRRLSHAVLIHESDPSVAVDVELYDMTGSDNAQSAYNGERNPAIEPNKAKAGLVHQDGNALYLTHGRYYLRAIGSEASARVSAQLTHLRSVIERGIAIEQELASLASVFDKLSIAAGNVRFQPENAFSFGFAKNVYIAQLGQDAELFIAAAADAQVSQALALQFLEGFASLGESESADGQRYVKDRYLSTYATALAQGPFVLGVHGCPSLESAQAELQRLRAAADNVPAAVILQAQRALSAAMDAASIPNRNSAGDGYGGTGLDPEEPLPGAEAAAPLDARPTTAPHEPESADAPLPEQAPRPKSYDLAPGTVPSGEPAATGGESPVER